MAVGVDMAAPRLSVGGLIYWALLRARIQQAERYCALRRIVLMLLFAWLPLYVLAALEGNLINAALDVPLIADVKIYARFLIAAPLLLFAGVIIDLPVADTIRGFRRFGFLNDAGKQRFEQLVEALWHEADSRLADVVIVALALMVSCLLWLELDLLVVFEGVSDWVVASHDPVRLTLAGQWSLWVSSPVLQIILYRWLWRFFLWARFLFRVAHLDLSLQATHPDLVGGLGILKNSQSVFIVVFIALATMISGALAEEILLSDTTFNDQRVFIAGFVTACLLIMVLPLTFFILKLAECKRAGRLVYGELAYKLSRAFDEKRARTITPDAGPNLLDSGDPSAVGDYAAVYGAVRDMRMLPLNLRDFVIRGALLLLPFAPLAVIGVPVSELVNRLIHAMA